MFLIMGVQLFTVRLVLETLGSEDYGINNVVGGIVSMFSFLSGTMAVSSQRFFSYEIGVGNKLKLHRLFSMTIVIYFFIAIVVLLFAETFGLWFLNNKMILPKGRLFAANWVYQFSLLGFFLSMFQAPYDSIIIAREKMSVYAFVSILQAFLNLFIVYLLVISPYDKLISYSLMGCVVTIFITSLYKVYCIRNFEESHFSWYWNKSMFIELASYSGWNMFGSLAAISMNQGINILLNLFFGPVINAARGIAYQINTTINGFVQNFMMATRPQIVKYYAQGDIEAMLKLVFQSSKFSFYLLFIITLPMLFLMPELLKIWLKQVPEYTVLFSRIILITSLIDCISYSVMAAFQATGKIKLYQMLIGSMIIMNIPISYFFLENGYQPQTALYVVLCNVILCLGIRIILLKKLIPELSIILFVEKVLFPILLVSFSAFTILYLISDQFIFFSSDYRRILIMSFASLVINITLIILIGINNEERTYYQNFIKRKIFKAK